MKFKLIVKLACVIIILPALCCADDASDREYIRENDPQISQALGIGTLQFEDCFYGTNAQDQYYKQSALLPCLQQYNPSITNDQLNQVLDQYRPERN
jgi:hypothetical protein